MNPRPLLTALAASAALAIAATAGASTAPKTSHAKTGAPVSTQASHVQRGKYLVTIMGCNDCHTPLAMTDRGPQRDWSRTLSGHPESIPVAAPPTLGQGWMAATSPTMTA